jgi:predicted ATP-grasp superfamily ATP-dependent carboligase
MRPKHFSILIPDVECYLLRAIVNGLAQVKDIRVYVMSNQKVKAMKYSRLVHKFTYYPKTNSELDWIANINKEIEKHNIDLVMPIWEVGIKTLTTHQDKILHKNRLVLLPALTDFNAANNKWLLADHLEANDIPYPKSVLVDEVSQFSKVDSLKFPIIIKPLEGFGGGRGIRMFKTKQDLDKYFLTNKFSYSYIVQEYIVGLDAGCSVLCKEGNILAITMQKENLTDDRKFAPPAGVDLFYDKKVDSDIRKLMKSLNWSGVANIDLRLDKSDNQYKVIEINPRFWGSTEASILAGVNFPYLYCLASTGKQFEKPAYDFIKYLNVRGVSKMIKRNKMFIFKTGFIFRNTPLKFALKDPVPVLLKFIKNDND